MTTTTTTTTGPIDLDAIRPATDLLITRLRETVGEIKTHDHPASGADHYCLNLLTFLGERMGAVLRRLADEQAETRKWQERNTALADEFVAEVDRLRAERDQMRQAATSDQQRVRTLVTDMAGETGGLASQVASLTAELEQARAERDEAQNRTSRLEDALAGVERQAAELRIAQADAEAVTR